ncbi:MAG: T9SS type A sorting domain-containing protein [Bacteroidetes bacterium]|nr:T9SS type A sorting domain-containing protein [Bacteroidota bacterium]
MKGVLTHVEERNYLNHNWFGAEISAGLYKVLVTMIILMSLAFTNAYADAQWDHVNLGSHTSGVTPCDGSIIVDAHYGQTGEFNVHYTLNGTVYTSGPYNSPNDIYINNLCAGVYSNITVEETATGSTDVWPETITIQVVTVAEDSNTDWYFECGDAKMVDNYGYNSNCNTSTTVTFPEPGNIYQYGVEIVYKGGNPGSSVIIMDDAGKLYSLKQHTIYHPWSMFTYRGVITGSTGSFTYDDNTTQCNLQSIEAYAFRNSAAAGAYSGQFISVHGYNDIVNFSLDIPTDIDHRNLNVTVPISEMTTDGRYIMIVAEAGGVSQTQFLTGPDESLPGGTCCLTVPEFMLVNVPPTADKVNITIDTRHNRNGMSVNGQSWVAAGLVNVNVDCALSTFVAPGSGILTSFDHNVLDIPDMDPTGISGDEPINNTGSNSIDDWFDDFDFTQYVGHHSTIGVQINTGLSHPRPGGSTISDRSLDGSIHDQKEYAVYPNPVRSSGSIRITGLADDIVAYGRLISIDGKRSRAVSIKNSTIELSDHQLHAGVYILEIVDGAEIHYERIMVAD